MGSIPIANSPSAIETARLALNPSRKSPNWTTNYKRNCLEYNTETIRRAQNARKAPLPPQRATRKDIAAIPVGDADPGAPTGPKLRYEPPPGKRLKQATLTQLSRSNRKKKAKARPVPLPRAPVEPPEPVVVPPTATRPPACTQESDSDFLSESEYSEGEESAGEDSRDSISEQIEKEWEARFAQKTRTQIEEKQQVDLNRYTPKPKFVTPTKTDEEVQWQYDRVNYAVNAPIMRVPVFNGVATNTAVVLPITSDTVSYPVFGYLSADKHSRDILLIDVLMPSHPPSGISPIIVNGGKRIIITYELRNGLHNERRITARDHERQYAMRTDFRRYVKQLPNGGSGATVTQVIDLPFVCHSEFFCEEELEQGWRVCVEQHVDENMVNIGVTEMYLSMQLLKQGEKKLKRLCPEICVKTPKKLLNY